MGFSRHSALGSPLDFMLFFDYNPLASFVRKIYYLLGVIFKYYYVLIVNIVQCSWEVDISEDLGMWNRRVHWLCFIHTPSEKKT